MHRLQKFALGLTAVTAVTAGHEVWRHHRNNATRNDRVDTALTGIDARDGVVLIIGGSTFFDAGKVSRHNKELVRTLDARLGGVSVVTPDFDTSPLFWRSLPDARQTMTETVRAVRDRHPDKQIVLVGDSLGAWGISHALMHDDVRDAVVGAGLVALPVGVHGMPRGSNRPDETGVKVIARNEDIVVGFPQAFADRSFWDTNLGYLGALATGLMQGDQGAWAYEPHLYHEHMDELADWIVQRVDAGHTISYD